MSYNNNASYENKYSYSYSHLRIFSKIRRSKGLSLFLFFFLCVRC